MGTRAVPVDIVDAHDERTCRGGSKARLVAAHAHPARQRPQEAQHAVVGIGIRGRARVEPHRLADRDLIGGLGDPLRHAHANLGWPVAHGWYSHDQGARRRPRHPRRRGGRDRAHHIEVACADINE
jgi:hypothetical protein